MADVLTEGAKGFSFRYYESEDKLEATSDISGILPGLSVIRPFVGNIELGAKVYPDDCKRAIDFFTDLRVTYHDSFCYIRIMDTTGDYPWFEVMIPRGNAAEDYVEGFIRKIEVRRGQTETDRDPDRLTFFGLLEERFNDMPLYDVPNLMIIKLTEYDTLALMNKEKADKALEESKEIIRGTLRDSDLICYVGGGIFFASLNGIKDDKILCDKAALLISTLKITWGVYCEESLSQTVAIGMSTVSHDLSLNIAEIYGKAAKALESAEMSHKNTYMFFTNTMKKEEEFVGRNVSLHDIELVKTILNPIHTWAYAVDEKFHLIYKNEALNERIPGECIGYCYDLIKGSKQQCVDCPLKKFSKEISSVDSDVYSPGLRRMLHCRTTRLVMRNNIKVYIIAESRENISDHITQLNESKESFNKAILKNLDIVWDIDLLRNSCKRIREVNVLAMTERRVDNYENLRRYYLDNVVCPEDREDFLNASSPAYLREAAKIGRESVETKIRLLYQDGTYHWYAFNTVFEDDRVFLSARDINELSHDIVKDYMTNRKYEQVRGMNEIQNELAKNYERSEHVNELTGIYVFEYDTQAKSYYLSTTFEKMFKVSDQNLNDEWSLLESLEPGLEDRDKYNDFVERVKREPDTHEITLRLMNKYDVALYFTITVQTLQGLNNRMARVTGCIQDVNTEMEIKAELEFRADYDSITGLYNSESFYRRTMERIFLKSGSEFAMIALDINRFRLINDRFGVEVGNNCLKELGKQISLSLPWDGIAGRYQADNFSILLEYEKDQDILDYIERLGMAFRFEEAIRCGSTLSFGIYKISDRDIPVRLMCDRARLAKKDIKGNTLTNFAVYDDRIRLQQIKLAEMESEMQVALDRHEFVMYVQPKVDLKTGLICGGEALVRWQHPIKGLRMPGDFLPLFENNGFIKKIDEYMWESTAIYLAKLKSVGLNIPISVNISRLHISNTDLIGELMGLVEKYGIEPRMLELEITETLFIDDTDNLYKTMSELKEKGFVIEMDDFGSGYSSLNMLKDAPVDVIKIDRFFIDEVIDTKRGKVIVANSIAMTKQLGLKVVAEGVENLEQVEFLKSVGCDIAQGYYYSKPVPQDEFEEMLKNQ